MTVVHRAPRHLDRHANDPSYQALRIMRELHTLFFYRRLALAIDDLNLMERGKWPSQYLPQAKQNRLQLR